MPPGQRRRSQFLAGLISRPDRDESGIDTTIIFALAIALVVNSHLEAFYPRPWLAADGLLGNSLFFLCSGFAVRRSIAKNPRRFGPFYWRRLLRIYPAVILAIALGLVLGTIELEGGIGGVLELFVWPTPFTYVALIMPFYAFIWLGQFPRVRPFLIASAPLALLAAMTANILGGQLGPEFDSQDISWSSYTAFFWCCAVAGVVLAESNYRARMTAVRAAILVLIIAIYLVLKFEMVTDGWSGLLAPLLLVLVFVAIVVAVATLGDPALARAALSVTGLGPALALIANLTLEIYVVHSVIDGVPGLSGIFFPANIIVLCLATLGIAIVLGIALDLLLQRRAGASSTK